MFISWWLGVFLILALFALTVIQIGRRANNFPGLICPSRARNTGDAQAAVVLTHPNLCFTLTILLTCLQLCSHFSPLPYMLVLQLSDRKTGLAKLFLLPTYLLEIWQDPPPLLS